MTEKRPDDVLPPTTFRQNYVEIYVGVAILGILAAIALPALKDARQQARSVSCLDNGKDLSSALLMYAQDYDGHLPLAKTWYDTRYNKNPLHCPELPTPEGIGYALDSRLAGRSVSKLGQDPATRALLYESSNLEPNAHDSGQSFTGRHLVGRPHDRSSGWIVYVDGHIKMYPVGFAQREIFRSGL